MDEGARGRVRACVTIVCWSAVPPLALWISGSATWISAAAVFAASAVAMAMQRGVAWRHGRGVEQDAIDASVSLLAEALDRVDNGAPNVVVDEPLHRHVDRLKRRIDQTLGRATARIASSRAELLTVESAFERVWNALRTLVQGVALVDERGRITLANPALGELLASEHEALQGRAVDLIPLFSADGELAESLARVQAGGDRIVQQLECDGRVLEIEITRVVSGYTKPVLDAPKRPQSVLVVATDLTEALEITRLKDELLSSMSHEMLTPLTNIVAYTEILALMTEQPPEAAEFLGIVQSESHRLHRILDNVLEYVRIGADHVMWDDDVVVVSDLVDTTVAMFAARAAERGASLDWAPDPDERAEVFVDASRIQRVFASVLDNAMKFAESESRCQVRIEVAVDPEAGRVAVRIHDSGPGIPEDRREQIFERLTQLGDPLVDKPGGTGMGLPLCVAILERYQGTIRCEASELGGACFVITLPLDARPVVSPTSTVESVGP